MSKRYKEFLIDLITKAYQIILAGLVISPLATKNFDVPLLIGGIFFVILFIYWGGSISAKMEE